MQSKADTCFFERDPAVALVRRAAVEGIGSLLLMFVATGAGLQAHRLFPGEPGFALLASALAIAGALAGLIVAFGAVLGGHFNPLITVLQWLGHERGIRCTLAYVGAQVAGSVCGAILATAAFGAARNPAAASTASWTMGLSELVASAGLMAVVFGCARARRVETGPFAVAAWLAGAILAMPSTSYANPAIAWGAVFAAGPIALDSTSAFLFIGFECAGALVAFRVCRYAYPSSGDQAGGPQTATV